MRASKWGSWGINPGMSNTRIHAHNWFAMGKKVSQREVTLDHTESPQRMTAQRGEDILEGVGPSPWKKAICSRWRNMGGREPSGVLLEWAGQESVLEWRKSGEGDGTDPGEGRMEALRPRSEPRPYPETVGEVSLWQKEHLIHGRHDHWRGHQQLRGQTSMDFCLGLRKAGPSACLVA